MRTSPSSAAPVAAALLLLVVGMTALFLHRRAATPTTVPGTPAGSIGLSVDGRPMMCYSFGNGPRCLFLMASIHGSEGAGTPLAQSLVAWLEAHPAAWQHCRLLVLPVANPDGLHRDRRGNARGVDLNRNFPAANRREGAGFGSQALSEPESRALHDFILRTQPDVIVSIHQPLSCVDYDGPAPAAFLAGRLASTTGLRPKKLGARPGSLGAWFGETLQRPLLTLELPATLTDDPDKLWSEYGPGLIDLVLHPASWGPPAGVSR